MTKNTSTSSSQPLDSAILDATFEQALGCLNRDEHYGLAVIEQWIQRPNSQALAAVAAQGSGAFRKAARRGLNVLRARGISVPDRSHTSTPTVSSFKPELIGYMIPPDASGALALLIASRRPPSNYDVVVVFLHDQVGIQRVELVKQSRTQMQDSLARLVSGRGLDAVPVPVEWARHRIAAAKKRHVEGGHPEPLGWASAAPWLVPESQVPPPHPVDEMNLSVSAEQAAATAADSASLHQLPEFRPWLPPREAVQALLAQVGEQIEPGTQPDQERVGQLIHAAVRAATDRLFSPQVREQLVSTMKDCTLSVFAREGADTAGRVFGTMDRIKSAGLITDPPSDVGFLRGFFDKAIAILLSEGKGTLKIPVRTRPAASTTETTSLGPSTTEAELASEAKPAAVAEVQSAPSTVAE